MAYFEQMRAFHEHYMPSGEILAHALEEIRRLDLRLIAPQHGLVIPEELALPLLDTPRRARVRHLSARP